MQVERTVEQVGAREKILESACRLFSQQGYENTALSQVARDAKVSKALVLWHFDSKEKLFERALRKSLEPYFVTVDEIEGLDEPAQLCSLVDQFYEFVRDNVCSVRVFLGLMLREEREPGHILARVNELYGVYCNVLADVIERGRRKGVFLRGPSSALDAALIMATLAGILVHQFMDEQHRYASENLLEHLKVTVLHQLGVKAR